MATAVEPANLDLYLALLGDLDPLQDALPGPSSGSDAFISGALTTFTRPSDDSSHGRAQRSSSDDLSGAGRTGSGHAPSSGPLHPPSSTSQPSEDAATRRKRPLTAKEELAELEKQIAEQTAALQRLSVSNAFLSERVKMLEVVIAVRDHQMKRCQAIKQGLTFDPMCSLETTEIPKEQLQRPQPSFVARNYLNMSAQIGVMLSSIVQDLQRHPYLLFGPEPGTPWPRYKVRIGPNGEVAPPLPERLLTARNGSSQVNEHSQQDASTSSPPCQDSIAVIRDVLDRVDTLMTALQHKWFTHVEVLTLSVNVEHALNSPHPDWPALLASIATNVEASDTGGEHTLAPESHWTQVLGIVSLTPHQLLQCAVLYDIFSQCKAAVATQRVTLAATLQRMQQKRPYNGARAQAAGPATDADAEATACCEKSVEVMMEEAAIIRRLQEGLVKERCLITLASETLHFHLLTPVQVALLLSNSFPYFPDEVALLQAAANEYQRRNAAEGKGV